MVKRRKTTPCHNLVKDILYQKSFNTAGTEYGRSKECVAIAKLQEKLGLKVEKAGFFVYSKNGCFGASPDGNYILFFFYSCQITPRILYYNLYIFMGIQGLVGYTHVVEVKCLYGVKKLGISLHEATEKKKTCLEIVDGELRLKRNHSYWFQIQGQMNITERPYCYFVVYVDDSQDIFLEEVERDEEEWTKVIYPALESFYNNCILEEIVRKNIPHGKKCYDPQHETLQTHKIGEKKQYSDT